MNVAQLQERLQGLLAQRGQLDAEIAKVLDAMKVAVVGNGATPAPDVPRPAPPTPTSAPAATPPIPPGTTKDRLVIYLGRNHSRYVSVADVAEALGLSETKAQYSLRDLRSKSEMLEAPRQNTWKLNAAGVTEYKRLEAAHRGQS